MRSPTVCSAPGVDRLWPMFGEPSACVPRSCAGLLPSNTHGHRPSERSGPDPGLVPAGVPNGARNARATSERLPCGTGAAPDRSRARHVSWGGRREAPRCCRGGPRRRHEGRVRMERREVQAVRAPGLGPEAEDAREARPFRVGLGAWGGEGWGLSLGGTAPGALQDAPMSGAGGGRDVFHGSGFDFSRRWHKSSVVTNLAGAPEGKVRLSECQPSWADSSDLFRPHL